MKSLLLMTFAAAGITMFAQGIQVRVHITEPVVAGTSLLQPGDYTITAMNSSSTENILRFESGTGQSVFVPAMKSSQANTNRTSLVIDGTSDGAQHISKVDVEDGTEYILSTPAVR